MWNWIKKIINKKINDSERKELNKKIEHNYSELSKGDLKKLQAQGVIKSIYKPYN